MQSKSKLQFFYAVLVLMVAQAHCEKFMCYVCENCAKITQNTPKEVCDESFFNKVETTQSPSIAAADTSITTGEVKPTSSPSTTSTEIVTEETTSTSTESTSSTNKPMPTAGTAGPPESTTVLPTPSTPGTVAGPIDDVDAEFSTSTLATTTPIPTTIISTSTSSSAETTFLKPLDVVMQPAQLRVRQLRSVSEYTYHCYTVQQELNGTLLTSRGCSRLNQNEALCPKLESSTKTKYSQCTPCSNTLCNGSGVIGVSAVAIILGLVSAFLLGFPA